MNDCSDARNCSICRDEIDFYSYGACDHPTCLRCAVKIRKFGSADEPDFSKCATCRSRLNRIVLMKQFKPFEQVDLSSLKQDMECDFFFEDAEVEFFYKKVLSCECTRCGHIAQSMSALNRHVTALHNLSYCDLCLRHARLLPCEFIAMNPSELSEHRKWNKTKKRGHPICEFCDRTFYEFEDLVKHIRESHFLCDFCNAAAIFVVFYKQHELFDHYKEAHFVCPECDAKGRTTCFASCDQLGLHRLHEHPRESENDPGRWDPVQIRYSNQGLIGQLGRVVGNRSAHRGANETPSSQPDRPTSVTFQSRGLRPEEWTGADFPSLDRSREPAESNLPSKPLPTSDSSNTHTTSVNTTNGATRSMASILGSGRILSTDVNEFPSLPSTNPAGGISFTQAKPTVDWARRQSHSNLDSSLSKKDKHITPTGEDFPGLDTKGGATNPNPGSGNWGRKSNSSSNSAVYSFSGKQTVPQKSDFPSLKSDSKSASFLQKTELPSYIPPFEKFGKQTKNGRNNLRVIHANTSIPTVTTIPKHMIPQSRSRKNPQWIEDLYDSPRDEVPEQAALNHIQTIDPMDHPGHLIAPHESSASPNFTPDEFPNICAKETLSGNPQKNKKVGNQCSNAIKTFQNSSGKNAPNQMKRQTVKTKPVKNEVLDDLEDTEIVLFAKSTFTPPLDFDTKNRKLIQVAEEALSQTDIKNSFTRFADLSRLYRYGQLSAIAYVQGLDSILGNLRATSSGNKLDWLGCMIELLPDIGRQRALLRALSGIAAPRIPNTAVPNRALPSPAPVWSKIVLGKLVTCSNCGQVCLRSSLNEHNSQAHS